MSDEKLKTLKDILNESRYSKEGEIKLDAVLTADLEQEAIKWIKYRISNCIFSCREGKMICREHRFWMERFNITEEDLKDE